MNLSKFLQSSPNVLLFRHAPLWLSKRYLHVLGTLYYVANPQEKEIIARNIKTVFKNNSEAETIVKKTFAGIFYHYSEKLTMAYRDFDILKKEFQESLQYSGLEYLDKALLKGGVILVTGHLGGVEFMPLAFHILKYPITMVVTFQTELLKKSLMERAKDRNVQLIDGEGDQVFQQSVQSLKNGRILLTECDEVDAWKPYKNTTVDAFGRKVFLDRTLEVLCKRSGATVLGAFMIRTNKGYLLTIVPLADEYNIGREGLSAVILKTFERFVMKFPDQWYQWKKFHKMCPEAA